MKCYTHKKAEAVGVCIRCGKGACDSCKVEFKEAIHCKNCIKKIGEEKTDKQDKNHVDKKPEETSDDKNNRRLIAVLISIFLPGLGLIYLGSIKRALSTIFIFITLYTLMNIHSNPKTGISGIIFVLLVLFWLKQIYRTSTVAEKINKGNEIGDRWVP